MTGRRPADRAGSAGGASGGPRRPAGGAPSRDPKPRPSGPPRRINRRADDPVVTESGPVRRKTARPRTAGPPIAAEQEPWVAEKWVDDGPVRQAATDAVARAETGEAPVRSGSARRVVGLPEEVVDQLRVAGGTRKADRLTERLESARRSFERERYLESKRILTAIMRDVSSVPAVRELYGLTLYRLGEWRAAIRELETLRQFTGDMDQHPVLADCYRALKRYSESEALWDELKAASPDPDIVSEGRIVMAGTLADQGKLRDAIDLLERASAGRPSRVRDRHLRSWYCLADLYDRAGDATKARTLFRRIATHDPEFVDIQSRLKALGR